MKRVFCLLITVLILLAIANVVAQEVVVEGVVRGDSEIIVKRITTKSLGSLPLLPDEVYLSDSVLIRFCMGDISSDTLTLSDNVITSIFGLKVEKKTTQKVVSLDKENNKWIVQQLKPVYSTCAISNKRALISGLVIITICILVVTLKSQLIERTTKSTIFLFIFYALIFIGGLLSVIFFVNMDMISVFLWILQSFFILVIWIVSMIVANNSVGQIGFLAAIIGGFSTVVVVSEIDNTWLLYTKEFVPFFFVVIAVSFLITHLLKVIKDKRSAAVADSSAK